MKKRVFALMIAMIMVVSVAAAGIAHAESGDLEPGVNGEVVISHWGGSTSEAYRQCYFNDFERETGIKVSGNQLFPRQRS